MMKAKEYRESIAAGIRQIRRLYDLDLVFRVIDLIRKMNASEELDRSVEQWYLIRGVLSDELTVEDLKPVSSILNVTRQRAEKRRLAG